VVGGDEGTMSYEPHVEITDEMIERADKWLIGYAGAQRLTMLRTSFAPPLESARGDAEDFLRATLGERAG
jgi:hypothetical protein